LPEIVGKEFTFTTKIERVVQEPSEKIGEEKISDLIPKEPSPQNPDLLAGIGAMPFSYSWNHPCRIVHFMA
jgi:hypothetical protein